MFRDRDRKRQTNDGPAIRAGPASPWSAAVDRAGNLYIVDTSNRRIRRVGADGNIATVAGPEICACNGAAAAAQPASPTGVAVDGMGAVYIADDLNHCVWRAAPALPILPSEAAA